MNKFIILTSILTLLAVGAVAQDADLASLRNTAPDYQLGVKPSFSPSSLLDGSRISWSHSYSVSFFSGGRGSGTSGLLNSTMFYDISSKLRLSLNMGVLHNNGSFFGANRTTDATFLPGFTLEYKPSDKTYMILQFQRVSGYTSPYYNNYYHPFDNYRSIGSPYGFR